MPDYIPSGAKKIARQSVKPKRTINGTQRTGTQMPKVNGGKQGMPPADWDAYMGTLNQRVTGDVYGREQGKPRTEAMKNPPAGSTVKVDKAEKAKADEKLLEEAKRRFKIAADAETSVRQESLDDLKFLAGEQWDQGIKQQRQTDSRPCLTINRLPQFVRNVTNEQRQNRPAIKVNPVDDNGDIETAEIIEGLCRHIEYDSGADAAYDTAFFNAAAAGYGFWRVITEYSEPLSFEQDIKIKRISNQFTVYLDPSAREPDFSDAQWGFVIEKMSKDQYKATYKNSDLSTYDDWANIGDRGGDWITRDEVRIAEYFFKKNESKDIVQFVDGSVYLKDQVPEAFQQFIVKERKTEITTVHWVKMNGHEILDETEWPGKWIPIVKIVGDEYDIDGKIILKGIVRDAKDPQRQFNYMKSAATEAIALAPKAPFIGAEGQFEGREAEWQQANIKNQAYLQYKPVTISGTVAPPPQRQTFEPAIQAINMAMMESADDLKAVTGIYDASLGAQGNEQSGKAILARQQQTQGTNFHYIDNLSRGIRHTGRILLDLIPHIYDTPRILRIIGEDGTQETVPVNQQFTEGEQTVQKIYDLSVGKYDVTISTGPSFQTRRQEATATQLDLAKVFPPLMGVAGDIVIKNMDIPQAQEIAERVANTIPPNIKGDDKNGGEVPPQAQQMIAQLTDQNQKLSQELHGALDDIEQKKSEKAMELESKERIEFAKIAADEQRNEIEWAKVQASLAAAEAKANAELSSEMAAREYDFINSELDRHHEAAMSVMEHQHGLESQDVSHQQGMESQQAAAEQEPSDASA